MRRTVWAAVSAALLVLSVGVPAASADSIAYIKDGNVWLSTPDGSRQYQVTTSGAYADVSQADDGTMIALSGVRLHRLSRDGQILADFDTPVSDTRDAPAKTFYGPFDPAIAPDGTKVAYTYYWMTQSQNPGCYPPECVVAINEGGTGYSWADRQTGWDDPALGYHSGWRHPVWVDGDTTMLSNPTHLPNRDVILDTISDGGNGHGNLVKNWFSDLLEGNPGMGGGDITRDKTKMAFQTGEGDSTLSVYYVPNFPASWRDGEPATGTDPVLCFRYSEPIGGKFGVPSLSPDGMALAFGVGDGIHVGALPAFSSGCTTDGATVTPPLVIPGGKEPDWGPADVPAPRPAQQPGGGTGGAGGAAGGGGTAAAPGAKKKLSVKVARATRRAGIKVRVKAPGKGRLSATAKLRGKVVGKASKRVKKAGTASLRVRVKRAGRVKVKVAFKPASGATLRKTLTVRVRR